MGELGQLGKTGPPGLSGIERPSIRFTHSKHCGERSLPGQWLIVSTALTIKRQKTSRVRQQKQWHKCFFRPPPLDRQVGHVRASRGLWLLAAVRDKKGGQARYSYRHRDTYFTFFRLWKMLLNQTYHTVTGQIKYGLLYYHAVIETGEQLNLWIPNIFTLKPAVRFTLFPLRFLSSHTSTEAEKKLLTEYNKSPSSLFALDFSWGRHIKLESECDDFIYP